MRSLWQIALLAGPLIKGHLSGVHHALSQLIPIQIAEQAMPSQKGLCRSRLPAPGLTLIRSHSVPSVQQGHCAVPQKRCQAAGLRQIVETSTLHSKDTFKGHATLAGCVFQMNKRRLMHLAVVEQIQQS